MNNLLSINVNIANKLFPMKVTAEEESRIRNAAKLINESIDKFKKIYGNKEPFDLLAMAALQISSNFIESDTNNNASAVREEINILNTELLEFIHKEKNNL